MKCDDRSNDPISFTHYKVSIIKYLKFIIRLKFPINAGSIINISKCLTKFDHFNILQLNMIRYPSVTMLRFNPYFKMKPIVSKLIFNIFFFYHKFIIHSSHNYISRSM